MTRPPRSASGAHAASGGFTLLELLVAVAVFALVAVMAYGGLDSVIRQSEIVSGQSERLTDFQHGLDRLQGDLTFAIDRPVRDSRGSPVSAFIGGSGEESTLLELTRLGAANPWAAPRGQTERVEWRLDGDRLQRRASSPPDGAAVEREDDWRTWLAVERVEATYFDTDNNAYPQWPPANRPDARLPRAVELRLHPSQTPPLRLTVALPGDWPDTAPGAPASENDDSQTTAEGTP